MLVTLNNTEEVKKKLKAPEVKQEINAIERILYYSVSENMKEKQKAKQG